MKKNKTLAYKEVLKFLLLLGVFVAYLGYLSWQYDIATGGLVAALTWSFFVLCTPVADAGFLLDFPVRLITGIRMIHMEIFVWVLAFAINFMALNFAPNAYNTTLLTSVFHTILTTPWPYWIIIFLCASGTFLSIYFGDEVLDVLGKSKKSPPKINRKLKFVGITIFYLIILAIYYQLLESLNLHF